MKPTILVVDDDPETVLALTVRLEASGYSVVRAGDGASAISAAHSQSPALIVLDLGLPDGDGYKVMEKLKSSGKTASIPIIVLTARDPHRNQEHSYNIGAFDFFQKPVPDKWLLASIERALGGRVR